MSKSLRFKPNMYFSDEAVRKAFGFIKENLMFDILQDELVQRKLLLENERDDYVCKDGSSHFINDRLIKLIIKKKRCKEFVELLGEMPCHKTIFDKILEVQRKGRESTLMGIFIKGKYSSC